MSPGASMRSSPARSVLLDDVGDLHAAHPAGRLTMTPRRPHLRGNRGLQRHRGAPPAGARCAEGLGPVAPLRGLRRPRRHRGTCLRRAAPARFGRLCHGRGDARAPSCSACCGSSAVSMPMRSQRLFDGARYAPAAAHRRGARQARARPISTTRRRMSPAIIRNGSIRILHASSATSGREEGAALASRAPLDLRVNTLKAEREEARAALAELAPEPTRWSPVGLRIAPTARREESRRSMPSRPSSRA